MPASLEQVEALHEATKRLLVERRKMARLSEKAANASLRQSEKASANVQTQAIYVRQIESEVHALAVDAGLADLRSPAHYAPSRASLSDFHALEFVPAQPKAMGDAA